MESLSALVYEGFCRDEVDRKILGDWYDNVKAEIFPTPRAPRSLPTCCVVLYDTSTGFDDKIEWHEIGQDESGVTHYEDYTTKAKTLVQHTTERGWNIWIATYRNADMSLNTASQDLTLLHNLYGVSSRRDRHTLF